MKNAVFLMAILFIIGCAFHRNITLSAEGKNLKTPYGSGDGKFFFNKTTSSGECVCPK